jgi:hypothetical protein
MGESGSCLRDFGFWILDFGFGFWILILDLDFDFGFWILDFKLRFEIWISQLAPDERKGSAFRNA